MPPVRRMHRSEYLRWVKRRAPVRYDLARSGVTRLPFERLDLSPDDITTVEPYDDGWRPVMASIAARHGLAPECVVTTHGCSMANHLAFAAFVEPGDHVVLETPVYEPLTRLVEYFGARVIPVRRREENAWRLDPDDVRRAITPRTTLVVLSNLHNPTGAFEDDAVLARIAETAAATDAHVLADEVYLEFLHAEGVRTAARIAPNVVATGSVTKAWGLDALRFGWVIAEPALAERIRRLDDLFAGSTAHPSARIARRAIERSDEFIAASNALHARNIGIVDAFVRSHERLTWVRPRAGTCGLVRVDGIDVDVLADRLHREREVAIVPGRFFETPEYVRLSWNLATSDLQTALARIGDAVDVLP